MNTPILRPLQIGDEKKLVQLFKVLTGKEMLIDSKSLIDDNKAICIVIEDENKLIGFGSIIFYNVPSIGEVARIEDLVVDEGYQSRGLGKAIMQELLNIAKKKKIQHINLRSNPSREHAITLYESLGFVKVETNSYYLKLQETNQ